VLVWPWSSGVCTQIHPDHGWWSWPAMVTTLSFFEGCRPCPTPKRMGDVPCPHPRHRCRTRCSRIDRPTFFHFWQRILGSGALTADAKQADYFLLPASAGGHRCSCACRASPWGCGDCSTCCECCTCSQLHGAWVAGKQRWSDPCVCALRAHQAPPQPTPTAQPARHYRPGKEAARSN